MHAGKYTDVNKLIDTILQLFVINAPKAPHIFGITKFMDSGTPVKIV
jgi:hypothetical protein